jgi:hypothetical protein
MITVAAAVERIVKGSPLLEEGLGAGLLNLSAAARAIRPQVEAAAMKPVSESAVIMALSRLAPRLMRRSADPRKLARQIRDVTVRSDISEFTYQNSDTILEGQRRMLAAVQGSAEAFVTFTRGVHELTVMASASLEPLVEKAFAKEKRVSRLHDLAAVGIHLDPRAVGTPGVFYGILKQFMWGDINVVEIVSTYTEFTLILKKRDVDRAFTLLKNYFWP